MTATSLSWQFSVPCSLDEAGQPEEALPNSRLMACMKREYDFSKAKRGPVIRAPKGQTRVTIPLGNHVVDWFRKQVDEAGGGDYQALINAALRSYIQRAEEPIENILRRVIREEMRRAS